MDIAREIERAHDEGVRREENLPFWIEPESAAEAGVLLVHGFTGSPWEMRLFGQNFAAAGYLAYGLRLPGHGTSPDDLKVRTWGEWNLAVEEGCRLLSGRCRNIYAVGQSTGALLVLAAGGSCNFSGQVLLSPYLRLRHRLAPAAWLLRHFREFHHRPLAPDALPFYYDRRPLAGVHQLNLLARHVHRLLPRLSAPCLMINAEGDRTIQTGSARDLFQRLGSARKEHHFYGPEVPHILTTADNPHLERTWNLVAGFIAELENPFPCP